MVRIKSLASVIREGNLIELKLDSLNWIFFDTGLPQNCVIFLTKRELSNLRRIFDLKMDAVKSSLWDVETDSHVCKSQDLSISIEQNGQTFEVKEIGSLVILTEREKWQENCKREKKTTKMNYRFILGAGFANGIHVSSIFDGTHRVLEYPACKTKFPFSSDGKLLLEVTYGEFIACHTPDFKFTIEIDTGSPFIVLKSGTFRNSNRTEYHINGDFIQKLSYKELGQEKSSTGFIGSICLLMRPDITRNLLIFRYSFVTMTVFQI
jgi:hypothetical protein